MNPEKRSLVIVPVSGVERMVASDPHRVTKSAIGLRYPGFPSTPGSLLRAEAGMPRSLGAFSASVALSGTGSRTGGDLDSRE